MPKEQFADRLNISITTKMQAEIQKFCQRNQFKTTDGVRTLLQIALDRVKQKN